ncbi:NifU family protein [Halomarina rubra]|uniref:NifU family protein n=1 Tax=Halomarina rubra TaxID=2071873 RepID=A0ABD6AZH7_9EURY|nr:NifU family protein [Halomarina rubra]
MSSDAAAVDENDLRERITQFLMRNFPQIEGHGGSHEILDLDVEAGSVTIALGGACEGCGVSPMTTQALEARLPREIPEIQVVRAETSDTFSAGGRGFDPDDVPF